MYPSSFEYYRAESVREAAKLLKQHPGAKLLAGGHSIIPLLKLRQTEVSALIDIGRIADLRAITGGMIGACCTYAQVAAASGLPAALTESASHVGDPAVRARGTIGGGVAHADPASDLPTVLLALNAKFHISKGRATRVVLANKFFIGLYETALKEDELLVGIEVEAEARGTGSAYAKLENPASRYAMVGAAASVTIVNGVCTAASVAVGGLTTHAWRSKRVPSALLETVLDAESISKAAKKVMKELPDDLLGDMHASADYRRAMSQVFVERALTAAAARAKK